jgi:glycerophosphoryl diester phosphodiesterase
MEVGGRPGRGPVVTYLGDAGLGAKVEGVARGLIERIPEGRPADGPCLVVGHRGAARLEAENTLASYERALALGADAIEADVCVTKDGRFVIWHDADPDEAVALVRQAGGEGLLFRPDVPPPGHALRLPVRELTESALQRSCRYVRAGDGPEGSTTAGEAALITLPELLAWAPGQAGLTDVLLDIKLAADQTAEAGALVDGLQDAVASGALGGLTVRLLCPQAEIVRALVERHRRRPDGIRVSADFELPGAPELAPGTSARDVSLGLGRRLWPGFRGDAARCVAARGRGAFDAVVAWTIDDPERLRELVRIGVDGILTDDPAVLRGIVGPRADPSAEGDPPAAAQMRPGRK